MFARFGRHVRQQLVGYVALFVALGGVSYAAVTLPRNSVGSAQIKPGAVKSSDLGTNAVTSAKVQDFSLLKQDFAAGQLSAGAPGPAGPGGPKGDTGAQGIQGVKGDTGTVDTTNYYTKPEINSLAGNFCTKGDAACQGPPATLPSGKTLTGTYAASDRNQGFSATAWAAISFPFPLASPPTMGYVSGATTTPECQGSAADPKAAPGYLCIYRIKETASPAIFAPSGVAGVAGKTGVILVFNSADTASGSGGWAVTAP